MGVTNQQASLGGCTNGSDEDVFSRQVLMGNSHENAQRVQKTNHAENVAKPFL